MCSPHTACPISCPIRKQKQKQTKTLIHKIRKLVSQLQGPCPHFPAGTQQGLGLFPLPLPPPMPSHPSQEQLWAQQPSALTSRCCQHQAMPTHELSLFIHPPKLNQDHFPLWVSPQNASVLFLSRALENFDSNGSYQNYTWVEFGKQSKKTCVGKNGKGSRELIVMGALGLSEPRRV